MIMNEIQVCRGEDSAETEGWEIRRNRERAHNPIPVAIHPRQKTAPASWRRSVLIITALSTLAWAIVVLIVIEALARL